MSGCHHGIKVYTLKEYIEYCTEYFDRSSGLMKTMEDGAEKRNAIRRAKQTWKRHVEKHGNVPMVIKCAVCSGKEFKEDVKHGRYKLSRPTKTERDEQKGKE